MAHMTHDANSNEIEMLFLNILQIDGLHHMEFRLDVIDRIAELGALSARHHQEVVNHECCNQQTAYDRLRELACPTRPLPTTESEAYYDFYFDKWIELSGIRQRLRPLQERNAMRDALRKLEFRCLRKAYAPGQSAAERMREAHEQEWA
jgi:hypothetical protein